MKQRILLVEDDMDTVNVMQQGLEFLGYEVIVAKNGIEAIDIATGEIPDIIVMDILMPKVDGLQAARQIRSNPNTQAIPILAATAKALPGDKEKCLEAGCDDYISKPMTHRELGAAVMELLRKRSK